MSNTPNSWEDAAGDDDLARQTQEMNLQGHQQAYRPSFTPGAASFTPGAPAFTPGAAAFTPGAGAYSQGYGYNQGYGQQHPQYGQQYSQYGQYGQQQHYGQYYQQPQQPAYRPPQMQNMQQPPKIAQRGSNNPGTATPTALAAVSAPVQSPKILKIGDSGTAPKVLKIGGDKEPKKEEEPKKEISDKPEAGSKTVAAKAVKGSTPTTSGKTSPSPSDGKTSPAPATPARTAVEKATLKREADAVAKAQEEEVDDALIEELYGKEHVNLVFIGHVDAGKSSLGGAILYATGMVDERTMEKFKREAKEQGRESWYLSWALDLTREERAKGKTVEVGRAYFETEKRRYTVLDAPGHKSYVPSMISGTSQADVGILVISARKGEYETGFEKGGQTREHAVLAKTQGVNKLVVVVNKMDDPTVEWSKERYDECIVKLAQFLKSTGYNPKTDVQFMPLSALTGYGLKDRIPKSVASWYDGPSLLEYLDNMKGLERKLKAPFMMPVSGKYKDMGTVIEGKVESGVVKKGGTLLMMPGRIPVDVVALYSEAEEEMPSASCGEQVRIRVRGVEEDEVIPGFVLTSPKNPIHCVTTIEAQIQIIELKSILTAGYSCVMHIHTAVQEVTFTDLLHKIQKGTGKKSKKPPPFASKGQAIIARLQATASFPAERFQDYQQLGRFTLRDQGQTIAIGKVINLVLE